MRADRDVVLHDRAGFRPARADRPAEMQPCAMLCSRRRASLFLSRGFASVTIRQIAAAAGSSPATIHYHFGDKLGLYRAMLAGRGRARRRGPAARSTTRRPGPSVGLVDVIGLYGRMLAANPWVPALIVQEVLTEGGPFRELFIEQFAGRLAPLLVALVRREQAAGTVRADVEPRLAALSAISLTVFPFLALPVASRVLGLSARAARRSSAWPRTRRGS